MVQRKVLRETSYLVVILCDNLMHPAEVVVWFKKLAKLLGEVFREG